MTESTIAVLLEKTSLIKSFSNDLRSELMHGNVGDLKELFAGIKNTAESALELIDEDASDDQ